MRWAAVPITAMLAVTGLILMAACGGSDSDTPAAPAPSPDGPATAQQTDPNPADAVTTTASDPLPLFPARVGLLEQDGFQALWDAEDSIGLGWLADPARLVFVQHRDGARWVVAGNPTDGTLAPLFPLEPLEDAAQTQAQLLAAPDGSGIVAISGASSIADTLRFYRDGADPEIVTLDGEVVGGAAWAPDARTLAVTTASHVLLFDPDGRQRAQVAVSNQPGALHWTADAARLFVETFAAELIVVEPESGESEIWIGPGAIVDDVALAPDGERIAVVARTPAGDTAHLLLLPATAAPPPDLFSAARASYPINGVGTEMVMQVGSLVWSQDGTQIAFSRWRTNSGSDPTIETFVMAADTGDPRLIDSGPSDGFHGGPFAWTPDGQTILRLNLSCQLCAAPDWTLVAIPVEDGPARRTVVHTDRLRWPGHERFPGAGMIGDRIYFVTDAGIVEGLLAPVTIMETASQIVQLMASPDGDRIGAILTQDGGLATIHGDGTAYTVRDPGVATSSIVTALGDTALITR